MTVSDVGTAITIGVVVGEVGRAVTRYERPGAGLLVALASTAAVATTAVLVRRRIGGNRGGRRKVVDHFPTAPWNFGRIVRLLLVA
ncbi:hypothetical protein ACQEVB_32845 [Pseudonocardia sp. CA-107938]|uniref:hypothetical protein n=1 Tax=Pseudonocardia sp. CA-107938 TaxID=3240021 RepID=UPI003D8AE9B7